MNNFDTINIEINDKINSSSILEKRGILLVLSSNFLGKTYIISKDKIIIGRDTDSDFFLSDPSISHKHCCIDIDKDNKFFIEDLNSTNKTILNGKQIKKRTQLIYGDRIIIGNTILRFFHEEKI